MPNESPQVVFDVLLRTSGTGRQPQPGTVADFRPDPDAVEHCTKWLTARGVICKPANFSLSCSASGEVFSSLFGVKVMQNPKSGPEQPDVLLKGKICVPEEIAELVDQVTLPARPSFFP